MKNPSKSFQQFFQKETYHLFSFTRFKVHNPISRRKYIILEQLYAERQNLQDM